MTSAVLVWTDRQGWILDGTATAGSLLNISVPPRERRRISLFFVRDRPVLMKLMEEAARGHGGTVETILRPRERRPVPVFVRLLPEAEEPGLVRWELMVRG